MRIELTSGEGDALAGGCAGAAERVAMGMAAVGLFLAVVVERDSGDSQWWVGGTGGARQYFMGDFCGVAAIL